MIVRVGRDGGGGPEHHRSRHTPTHHRTCTQSANGGTQCYRGTAEHMVHVPPLYQTCIALGPLAYVLGFVPRSPARVWCVLEVVVSKEHMPFKARPGGVWHVPAQSRWHAPPSTTLVDAHLTTQNNELNRKSTERKISKQFCARGKVNAACAGNGQSGWRWAPVHPTILPSPAVVWPNPSFFSVQFMSVSYQRSTRPLPAAGLPPPPLK